MNIFKYIGFFNSDVNEELIAALKKQKRIAQEVRSELNLCNQKYLIDDTLEHMKGKCNGARS